MTWVKIHWQILFDKVFALCKHTHFAKYSLANINCQRNFVLGNVALFDITYFLDKSYDSIHNFCPQNLLMSSYKGKSRRNIQLYVLSAIAHNSCKETLKIGHFALGWDKMQQVTEFDQIRLRQSFSSKIISYHDIYQ